MREEDRESFEAWSRARQAELLRAAFWMTGDFHRAEDLVQEALIGAAMRWDSLQSGNPDGWVRTVMYRRNISLWRRRRHEVLTAQVPDRAVTQLSAEADQLQAALQKLPPRQRAVICLRYLEDLSVEQTAAVLGVTTGSVKKQASVALGKLRALSVELEQHVEERA